MFFVNDPGPWPSFVLRGDNVGRPINEVTQKYLNEQLQFDNFISMQQQLQAQQFQNKGFLETEINNYITSINFGGDELTTISGFNDAQIIINFNSSVEVTGTPYIDVLNQQQGLGADSTIRYTYSSGGGTNELIFIYIQPANETNIQSEIGAYAIDTSYSGQPSADYTLNGCTDGIYTVTGTWASGSISGDVSGGNVSNIQATVVSNAITNLNFTNATTATGKRFTPGNTLTIQGSDLGAEGSGNWRGTIDSTMLLGDINDLTGTSITLDGGTIINTEGGTPNLTYISTDTKTAVAT